MSCHVMSCYIMSYHVVSCHVMSTNLPNENCRYYSVIREYIVQSNMYIRTSASSDFLSTKACTLCTSQEVGDEYHYHFNCSHFINEIRKYVNQNVCRYPNSMHFKMA